MATNCEYAGAMAKAALSCLGSSVSPIGLGCMRLTPERQNDANALIDCYRSLGGNLLDTAEIYGGGQSERAIGRYLKTSGCRKEVTLVTKGCVEPRLVRPDYIRKAIDRSLERLGCDWVDVYLLHRDDPQVPVGELLAVLNDAMRAGKIRAFGGSNWTVARLAAANETARAQGLTGFTFSSPHVGLATPREPWWPGCTHATAADLEWYAADGMCILGWSSQCRGFFSKTQQEDLAYVADLVRVYYSPENLARRERLLTLAERMAVDPGMLAVRYVLSLSARVVALVGPLSVEDLKRVMVAGECELSSEHRTWLEVGR